MKINKGDAVEVKVEVHGETLLKGVGVIISKFRMDNHDVLNLGDLPDEDRTHYQDDCWTVYMLENFFMIREKYMKKIENVKN